MRRTGKYYWIVGNTHYRMMQYLQMWRHNKDTNIPQIEGNKIKILLGNFIGSEKNWIKKKKSRKGTCLSSFKTIVKP